MRVDIFKQYEGKYRVWCFNFVLAIHDTDQNEQETIYTPFRFDIGLWGDTML